MLPCLAGQVGKSRLSTQSPPTSWGWGARKGRLLCWVRVRAPVLHKLPVTRPWLKGRHMAPMTRWVEASLVLGGMKSPAPHLALSNTAGGEAVLPRYSLTRWRYRLPLTFAYWEGGRVTVSLYYLLGAEQQLPRRLPSFQAVPFLVLLLERLSLGLFCLFPLMFLGCWLL